MRLRSPHQFAELPRVFALPTALFPNETTNDSGAEACSVAYPQSIDTMTPRLSSAVLMAVLALLAALLYFRDLGSSPPYLSVEEVSEARHALSFAATGRDMNGAVLPMYFPERGSGFGREPVFVYVSAAVFRFVPFSEAAARAPSALAGVLDVLLMFVVARKIFKRSAPAVVAACLLMLTPAHFTQSRIGTQQIGTVTCVLGWLACLLDFLDSGRLRRLFAATACLAFGMYVYYGGLLLMPVFFALTVVVVWRRDAEGRRSALWAACAGYLCVLVPLFVWCVTHLDRVEQLAFYYTHGDYNSGMGSAGFFGPGAIAHLDAWWQCFSPERLWFVGDADYRFSTRAAGYFLLPFSLPMIAGTIDRRRTCSRDVALIVIAGLVLAPLPAAFVSNTELKRWLPFLPFATLATTAGIQRLLTGDWRLARGYSVGIVLIAKWLTAIPSFWLVAVLVAAWTSLARRRLAYLCVAGLALLGALQMTRFLTNYFGAYRLVASEYLGGNLKGAIRGAIDQTNADDCVRLDRHVYYLEDQWDLYVRVWGSPDLEQRTAWLDPGGGNEPPPGCHGVTVLGFAGDERFSDWRKTLIPEIGGPARLAVYRRDPH